jgi:hypothetical protein
VGYTADDSFAMWDTVEEYCFGVRYNGEKIPLSGIQSKKILQTY